ncbi:MAG: GNAT family N-acetyltransferase [Clostridia bacterium]|nr:GNAT family N-acetyltransferase [Clostridia bacterium]
MKKLTILVDWDGTIEDFMPRWVERINRDYGFDKTVEDLHSWDMRETFVGLTTEQIEKALHDPEFWRDVPPVPGAAETMARWREEGHTVFIATAAHYYQIAPKTDLFLKRYFPFMSWNDVIVTHHKQLLKADVLIDDGVHNLLGGEYARVLLDAPYNRFVDDEREGIVRVRDWREIAEYVDRLAAEEDGRFVFRHLDPDNAAERARAVETELICFPPNEACRPEDMQRRFDKASEYFLVAVDRSTGLIAGFCNGVATDDTRFTDKFFTDIDAHVPGGKNVMILGLDVRPEYRRQGLATALMARFIEEQRARGCGKVYLTCLDHLVKMYEGMGYRDNGTSDSVWGGCVWHEMEYSL